MRRLLVMIASLLVGLVVTSAAVAAETKAEPKAAPVPRAPGDFNGKFPVAGWWKVAGTPEQRAIHRTDEFRITWNFAYVYPYDREPLSWRAELWVKNIGNQPIDLSCPNTDPSTVKEHIRRRGSYLGHFDAESTFCLQHGLGHITTLQPGETFKDWAEFHKVPWRRDKVSIEAVNLGRTAFVRPWGRPVNHPPPPRGGAS